MRLRKAFASKQSSMMIGLVMAAMGVAAVAFAYNAVNGNPLAERRTVLAEFEDVSGLLPGDDVRIASSRVGYVEDIRSEERQSVVVLKIDDPTIPIYRNASAAPAASLSARSALGQKFVDLATGTPSAGELGPGEVIPLSDTRSAQELTDLLDVFDEPTRRGAATVLRELGGGMGGRSQDLNDLLQAAPGMLPDLGTVSRSLTVNDGADLTGLMESAKTLASRFDGREQEIANLTRQLGTTLDAVAVDGGAPLGQTLERAPDTLRAARGALDALSGPLADTEVAMSTLRPGGEALGMATADLRGVLREGVPPLDKVPGVSGSAEPAVEHLTEVMADARPLTPRVVDALDRAATPLGVLGPYSGEISGWFTNATDMLSHGDDAGHWGRFLLLPRSESLSGTVPVEDPTVSRNSYPAPGQAADDAASSPLIGERDADE